MTTELTKKEERVILKMLGKHCERGSISITGFWLSTMTDISSDRLFQYGIQNPDIYRLETRENDLSTYFFINGNIIPTLITNAQ